MCPLGSVTVELRDSDKQFERRDAHRRLRGEGREDVETQGNREQSNPEGNREESSPRLRVLTQSTLPTPSMCVSVCTS